MATEDSEPISRRKKIDALLDVARYKPRFTAGIVLLGVVAAVLEGVGDFQRNIFEKGLENPS